MKKGPLILHPSFCPATGLWTARDDRNGFRRTAPTIRELLTKFPPGTTVRDYYPNGDTPITNWPKGSLPSTNLRHILPHSKKTTAMNRRFIPKTAASRDHGKA